MCHVYFLVNNFSHREDHRSGLRGSVILVALQVTSLTCISCDESTMTRYLESIYENEYGQSVQGQLTGNVQVQIHCNPRNVRRTGHIKNF